MENKEALIIFLILWLSITICGITYVLAKKLKLYPMVISLSLPSFVAFVMFYLFIIKHTPTIVQFAGDNDEAFQLWSLWYDLWRPLLFFSAISALSHIIWLITTIIMKNFKTWFLIILFGLIMSIATFYVVILNFPDA